AYVGRSLASESFCFRTPRFRLVTHILKQARFLFTLMSASATARLTNIQTIFVMAACFALTIQTTTSSTRKLWMEGNRKSCLKFCSIIPPPRWWCAAALPMAGLRSGFNALDADSVCLQNSLFEFRRCINDCECLGFPHENARTSAARRDDVSRTGE